MMDPRVAELVTETGLGPDPAICVTVDGEDPVLPAKFPVGTAAAVALGACGAAAAHLHAQRTGVPQQVHASVRHAAASLVSFRLQRLKGQPPQPPHAAARPAVGLYQCADGRWIHLHGSFPRLLERTVEVLGCAAEQDALAAAVRRWTSADLEDALAQRGTCGAVVRSAAEWSAHPQGAAVGARPRVEVLRVGDAPARPLPPAGRPLESVRVLELTRVLAGPVCGRTLAQHGADVLLVNSPSLPNVPAFVMDTSHGKRSAFLDLNRAEEAARLRELVRAADVFVNGYRSGALERRGLGPAEVIEARPGAVYVSLNCYGHVGPWVARPGWEQLAQSVTGLAAAQGTPDRPELLPAAACDYTTGYLAALGTMAALARRATEGGSWHVRVSLVQTGMWLQRLGPVHDPALAPGLGDVSSLCQTTETPYGSLTHLRPALRMSITPPAWAEPTAPPGTHPPGWATRAGD